MRIFVLAALSLCAAYSADKITVYESDHFELITDGSKGRAQEILGQFERVKSFFNQVMPLQEPLMKPRIVVFSSEKDFREFAPSEVAAAYYTPMPHRDMIAIGSAGRDYDQQKVVHEYLHMLVRYTDGQLPLWMDEGIAEVYSTIQPLGKKIQVGAPIANHMFLLQSDWLGLENVVGVDHASPIYNRRAHAGGFYASSWALVHMLQFGEAYKANYGKFATAVESGKPTDEAFLTVYGKSLKQVDNDLRLYVRERSVNTLIFDMQFDKSFDKIQPREATAYEWEIARADLMTATRKYDVARARLEALAKSDPTRPEAWESLAFLHWVSHAADSQKNSAEAFKQAMALKSTNPNLAFNARGLTSDTKLIGASLQLLVERYPNYIEGRLRLAEHLLYDGETQKSYDEVKKLKRISRRQAPLYFPVLIQTSWRLKKLEECRIAASQFKQVARTPAEKDLAKTWFTYAMREPRSDRAEVAQAQTDVTTPYAPPPPRPPAEFDREDGGLDVVRTGDEVKIVGAKITQLEGTLVNLECKNPQAILSIKTDSGITRLLIEDPTNVNLKMNSTSTLELTCGPQANKVKAGYFPRENAAEKTIGALATLEFLK